MRRKIAVLLILTTGLMGSGAFAVRRDPIPEDILNLRDPFKRPTQNSFRKQLKSFLESYASDAFKVVAIMTGPQKVKAMILTPDGRSFFVSEKAKIGLKGGFIRKITPESVVIQETTVNLLGLKENQDIELKIGAAATIENSPNSMPSGHQGE